MENASGTSRQFSLHFPNQILIEIYFYNKIISRNNFENDYKSFKQTMYKINNMNKFNLDKNSSLLEIKNIIVNER